MGRRNTNGALQCRGQARSRVISKTCFCPLQSCTALGGLIVNLLVTKYLHCSLGWDLRNPSEKVALCFCFWFNQALAAPMLLSGGHCCPSFPPCAMLLSTGMAMRL